MSLVGAVLIAAGLVSCLFGVCSAKRVRRVTSQGMWLTVSALVLFAGLALQAAAEGWDITR